VRAIQPGGEPFLFLGRSGIGCLLLHGLTSAPQELRGLGEYLAARGHTVLGLRLPAHATSPRAMIHSRWQEWLAAAEDGYHLLKDNARQVAVIGLSLGGAIALLLAAGQPVGAVVAMSTPYEVPPQPRLRFLRLLLQPLAAVGRVIPFLPKPPPLDYRDPVAARDHLAYPVMPVRAVTETARLLRAMREQLGEVRAPVLLMHSIHDGGVTPENARSIFGRVGSEQKRLLWLAHSGHVLTVEPARQQVYQAAAEFVEAPRPGAGRAADGALAG
jgi:carboxylesterase